MRGGICHRGRKEWKRGVGRRDKMETDTIRGDKLARCGRIFLGQTWWVKMKVGSILLRVKVLYFMLITFDEWAIFIFLLAFSSWMNERWDSFVRHSHLFRDIFFVTASPFFMNRKRYITSKDPFLDSFYIWSFTRWLVNECGHPNNANYG